MEIGSVIKNTEVSVNKVSKKYDDMFEKLFIVL